jgi:hypothetical protein
MFGTKTELPAVLLLKVGKIRLAGLRIAYADPVKREGAT